MRTSLHALLMAVLGYVAALLSIGARRRMTTTTGTTTTTTTSSTTMAWSDALISDAPTSQRLLLSRDGVEDREGLAAEWRAVGRRAMEAIASSSQLSVDLVTLGAPPSLIARANEDALDEIRHAKICFALARAIDGRVCGDAGITRDAQSVSVFVSPRMPLPRAREAALAIIAALSLEAAFIEGLSARMNAKLARRAIDKSIRSTLEEIALLEARHATHAWAVIEWCLADANGGAVVEHSLRAAQTLLLSGDPRAAREIPRVASEGGWERWGIAGSALEEQELEATRRASDRRVASFGVASAQRLVAA